MDFVIYSHTLDGFSEIHVCYVPKEIKKKSQKFLAPGLMAWILLGQYSLSSLFLFNRN